MKIDTLSDNELASCLDSLAQRERENAVEFLHHLNEFETRGLYRELGYSSLHVYCTKRLKLSDGAAYRRVHAARCLKNNPEIESLLVSGELTLCSVATAAKSIEKKVVSITEIAGCSKREVESLVAASSPLAEKPREVIKPLVLERPATLVEAPKREERVELRFSVKKATYEKFKALQAELSIEAGKQLSVEEAFERLM